MQKLSLSNITLIVVDCYNYGSAVASIQKSMAKCDFGAVKFLTDIPLELEGIEVVKIPSIKSKDEYSHFIIKELYKYFDTEFVFITQHDSWVLFPEAWEDCFLNFDYLGASWLYIDSRNVGNGGASIRSKRLQYILGTDDTIEMTSPEDEVIGRLYRHYLEETHGIKFPSEDIADRFSFELREPKCKTFTFHGYFHEPYQPTVILKRSGALGDIVLIEPVMRYYAMKGFNVVLDIPVQFFDLFTQHYFPVKHISSFDSGRINPEKEVNLDLAYEVKPQQTYLKSYFEFCGIRDYQLTRPQLFPLVNEKTKLFKKYAVIHIDNRETPHRNIYGINWKAVQRYLEGLGYLVLQIGKGQHDACGVEINTSSVAYMKFVIAGCDLFIGVDSGPSHIAVAYNKPSIICFGSVNPDYIHCDLRSVQVIQSPCEKAYCWHIDGGTAGKECVFRGTEKFLQCCKSDSDFIIENINKLIINE